MIYCVCDFSVSPMIWVPNQLVGAPSGTDVTIDCQTEAHPKSINYWSFRDSKTMLFPSKKYTTADAENSYRIHMRLTIKDLGLSDFGNYKCISKNSLGETEGSIRLYGQCPLLPGRFGSRVRLWVRLGIFQKKYPPPYKLCTRTLYVTTSPIPTRKRYRWVVSDRQTGGSVGIFLFTRYDPTVLKTIAKNSLAQSRRANYCHWPI